MAPCLWWKRFSIPRCGEEVCSETPSLRACHYVGGADWTRDVLGALAWLEEEGFEPGEVVLHGWSMGGATVS